MQATTGAQAPKKTKAKEYLKGWVPYRIKRYWLFVIVTVVALVLPFIKINGNHFFLLNFDHKQLHFLFVRFDMQELYLMPFLLMLLFLGIFFMTTLGGRVWCGWACPQTIFRVIYRDLFETKLLHLRKRIMNKQQEPDWSKPENKAKEGIAILLWSVLALIAAADFLWYFVPPEDFFQYIQNPGEHPVLIGFWLGITLFLIVDVVWLKENFCIYICPYSRVQSVMYDDDTIMAIYDVKRGGHIYDHEGQDSKKLVNSVKELRAREPEAECTACESCVKVCPTHIDIRQGMQLECINCLECVDACTKVMGALGKESLVRWTSPREIETGEKTHYIRPRTIAYAVALTIVFVALLIMGTKKEHMLLNINKTAQLYRFTHDGRIVNDYTIVKPSKPFKLKAIRAYAVDDPEKIVVERHTVFVYPRWDIVQKKLKKAE